MRKKHIYLFFLVICPLLPGCGPGKDSGRGDSILIGDTSVMNDSLQMKYRSLIENLPAPVEMLRKLTNSGITFRDSLVNVPENVSRYSNTNSQAINLGIYGADMAYLTAMEQFGQVGPYIRSVKKIADVIVIPTAFDEGILKQYDKNRSNRDTLNEIIVKSYKKIDATLQDNQRLSLATLVVCGSWIEAMYITTQHLEDTEKKMPGNGPKSLYEMLDHQKAHLESLSKLAGNFNNDPFFNELKTALADLAVVFPDSGAPSAEQLKTIAVRVAALRTRMVNME